MRQGLIAAAVLMTVLAGCSYIENRFDSPPRYDTRDRAPEGPPGQCRTACDGSFARCNDSQAARRQDQRDSASDRLGLGGQAVCERELQRCLKRCVGQP